MFKNMKDIIKSYKGMAITLGVNEWDKLKEELYNNNDICKQVKEKLDKHYAFVAYGNTIYYENIESKFYTHRLTITNITPKDDISVYIHYPSIYSNSKYGM